MGKGDKKTRKGKLFMGSFGKSRKKNSLKNQKKAEPAKTEKVK